MAALWTNLPSEILVYILEKISERDLKTFLAASAVCRDWRCSSSLVSSISFTTDHRYCEKHYQYWLSDCSCFTDCIRSVLARSKSVSKLRVDLDLVSDRSMVCDVLGKCNWLGTLQEFHLVGSSYDEECIKKLLQVLRSCNSLSVWSFRLYYIGTEDIPEDLILTNLKSLSITGYISNEVIQLLMERAANLEHLVFRCYHRLEETVVLNAPKSVVRMELEMHLAENVSVNAAGVKHMIVNAQEVELKTPLLEELTLYFGTEIIKGSPPVRRLSTCSNTYSWDNVVCTLSSCVTLLGIKTLCISTGRRENGKVEDSRAFFELVSKLTELEELQLNFDMVMQLLPEGRDVTAFFPKLKTLTLGCSVCALDDKGVLAERKDSLLEKFRSAWEYLKSVMPAQVVIRNEHRSRLTEEVDLLQHTSTCT